MRLFNLLTRIICTSVLVTVSPCVFAGSFSGAEAQKILDQNPQLKTAGVLPTNISIRGGNQCGSFSGGDHDYHNDAFKTNLKGVTSNHTCIDVESDKGFKSYEKGYGEKRYFKIVLYRDTPKVWRVYEFISRRKVDLVVSILAEFDIHGKRIAATTSESSRQAEQSPPESTNRKGLIEQRTDDASPPPSAESQVENVVQKGIGNLLKGF